MTEIRHHLTEPQLVAYASGSLSYPFAMVVAAHVSMCAECRARLGAHEVLGGAVMEDLPAETVSDDLKDIVLARLDGMTEAAPAPRRRGIYPGPVAEILHGEAPKWRSLGRGNRQAILHDGPDGSVRLLHIPPGQAVPDHGHNGLELTLVLQGSFADADETFGVGDVEVADDAVEHTPVAGDEMPCICLAATDAPLRFRGLVPRMLQPIFRI